MLLRQHIAAHLPLDVPRSLVDDANGRYAPKAHQHAVVRQGRNGIAVRPVLARVVEGKHLSLHIHVLMRQPRPHAVPLGIHLHKLVRPHVDALFHWNAALHRLGELVRHSIKPQVNRAARLRAPPVVMVPIIVVLPEDVPIPVRFDHRATLEDCPCREGHGGIVSDLAVVKEVAVRQHVSPEAGRMRHLPPVYYIALQVDDARLARPEIRSEHDIAGTSPLLVECSNSQPCCPTPGILVDGSHGRISLGESWNGEGGGRGGRD